MEAFTRLPQSVKEKYDLEYTHAFDDFIEQEVREGGRIESVIMDMQEGWTSLLKEDNEKTSHPFFTDSQVNIITEYCEGYYTEALIRPNEDSALASLGASDGLLRCMVALGDEKIPLEDAINILKTAISEVKAWQEAHEDEDDSASPTA